MTIIEKRDVILKSLQSQFRTKVKSICLAQPAWLATMQDPEKPPLDDLVLEGAGKNVVTILRDFANNIAEALGDDLEMDAVDP